MQRKLYFECESGISGDMTVAALLDLGADREVLDKVLSTIKDQSFQIKYSRVKKSGLDCMDFDVILDDEHSGHDHDMEYLYGHTHEGQEHSREHNHSHSHHHDTNDDGMHHHSHRSYKEVMEIVDECQMTEGAHKLTEKIFSILADAESKAHGIPVEEVHFHEVGAIDSIVDIVSIAVCLDNLGYTNATIPYLCEGKGTVRCQHGILPVPVPAVSNIAMAYDIPIKSINVDGELVTPTGAAVVAALRDSNKLPDTYTIKRIGMGAGKRDYGLSGILRIMEIEDIGD